MATTIHQCIRDYLYANKISVRTLAFSLKMSDRNVYLILKDGNITIAQLQRISSALSHNFFTFFTGGADTSGESATLKEENAALQQRIMQLEKDIVQLELINKLLMERGK